MLPLMFLLILLTGCADLIVRDTDSTAEVTGKVAARTLLVPLTLGLSELGMSSVKARDICDRKGGWYFMGGCRDNSPETRHRAMLLAPMFMQSNLQSGQMMQQPLQPFPAGSSLPQSQPLRCTSYPLPNGTSTMTCY